MPEETEPRFETALEQLEAIVQSLERGEPDLSAALAKYETGVRLLNQCYGLLERAERSVALLTGVDAQGNPTTDAIRRHGHDRDRNHAEWRRPRTSPPSRRWQSPIPNPLARGGPSRRSSREPEHDRFDPPF